MSLTPPPIPRPSQQQSAMLQAASRMASDPPAGSSGGTRCPPLRSRAKQSRRQKSHVIERCADHRAYTLGFGHWSAVLKHFDPFSLLLLSGTCCCCLDRLCIEIAEGQAMGAALRPRVPCIKSWRERRKTNGACAFKVADAIHLVSGMVRAELLGAVGLPALSPTLRSLAN